MHLKLRNKKNKSGQKIWSIYSVLGTGLGRQEKLYKNLGPIPKALALKIFDQSKVTLVCSAENIRQNVDISFSQVCDEYLDRKCRPPHKTENTYKQNQAVMKKQIKRVMGNVFDRFYPYRTNKTIWIHDINLPILDGYKVARKEENVSNRTINIELNLIRGVMRYALESNYMIRFPLSQFKNLPEEQPKRVWVEDISEIEKLTASADTPMTYIKMKLGFEAGLRKSEILKIRLDGINIENRLLTIYGEKENRYKEIPLSEEMVSLLTPLLNQRYKNNGRTLAPREPHQSVYLFCNDKGEAFKSFGKGFYRAKERAGITRKLGPHSMRHSFASHLLQNGANPVDVSKMLGHKKVSTTLDIYGHSSREGRLKAFERLPYLHRQLAEVIPLRKVVNGPEILEGGSKWGVNQESALLENLKNFLSFNERETGFEPATLSLGS